MSLQAIVFLGKKGDSFCELEARALLRKHPNSVVHLGNRLDGISLDWTDLKGDLLISYLCPWVIPQDVLDRFEQAINFHPGSENYPGIGCTNFALFHNEEEFGVTAHFMKAKVDTGAIIKVNTFPIEQCDTVKSLTDKCYIEINKLYKEIMKIWEEGESFPLSHLKWTRKPYTRKELNALCKIDASMDKATMLRVIRAVSYQNYPGAYVELNGLRFEYNPNLKSKKRKTNELAK
ncbi:MAG: hypothetical protein KC646_06055 [Candidatus Cloacimonetes bacterium]|nr:hypothetical protein [Candidatus Cloacimonadota bacterium]